MQPLPNYDLRSIDTVDRAVSLIQDNLAIMAVEITNADFTDTATRSQLVSNIDFLRQYYTAVERLLLTEGGTL